MNRLKKNKIVDSILYSFPLQLLINHFKRNHSLLFVWFILFLIVYGYFGRYLGIPYLFLDPEYMYKVSFTSFFIMGFVIAGFAISFHVTAYIVDVHRFPFLGALPKPFSRFSLNNSVIPVVFLIIYIIQVIKFQKYNEFAETSKILEYVSGILLGYFIMMVTMFIFFRTTNKDIFRFVADSFNEKLKKRIRVTRARVLEKMQVAKKHEVRVDNYFELILKNVAIIDQGEARQIPLQKYLIKIT